MLLSVLIGISLVLIYGPHDTWVHNQLHTACNQFLSNSFSCSVDFERFECSLIHPSITFHSLSVCASDASWSWKADRCIIRSSWWDVWERGCIACAVLFEQCTLQTMSSPEGCCLVDHCNLLLQQAPALPIQLQSGEWCDAAITIVDAAHDARMMFNWSGTLQQDAQQVSGTVQVTHVAVEHKERLYINDGTLTLSCAQLTDNDYIQLRVDGLLYMSFLSDQTACALHGIWRNGSGRFSLRDTQGTFSLDPFIITQHNQQTQCTASGRIAVDALWRLRYGIEDTVLSGNCAYSITAQWGTQSTVSGCVTLEQLAYNDMELASSAQLVGKWCDDIWRGSFSFLKPPLCGGVQGTWELHDNDNTAYFQCTNNGIIHAPSGYGWTIMPRDLICVLSRDKSGALYASYQAQASQVHIPSKHELTGSLELRNGFFVGRGSLAQGLYMFDGIYSPYFKLDNAAYYDEHGQCAVRLQGEMQNEICTAVIALRCAWLRGLVRAVWGYDVHGDGMCHIRGSYMNNVIQTTLALQDAHIRIPGVNNFIHEITAHGNYNLQERCGILSDCMMSMHTGRVFCKHATFGFDKTNVLEYIHAPCVMHHCLLHPHNDLYATISGHACARYTAQEGYMMEGHCFLDRAYLKESPFSTNLLKQLESPTFDNGSRIEAPKATISLAIESKEPIRIETSHLNARALVDLKIKGTTHEPALSGSLKLVSGSVLFPYRPLSVIGGGMQFDPTNMYDPQIQLIAKDKVRSYMVGLHATGSLQHPEIILESWPVLSDEKIASLLLTGSEHEGLNIMMPAAITQRINQMIFRNEFPQSSLCHTPPFNIHVVPSFTNQTARGGLRAALEIDIGDRWHALIQKNFSLTEDTRVEIEYQATDDITVRAIRDERRDISAECELRWKF